MTFVPLERGSPAKGRYIHIQFVARTLAFAGKPRSNGDMKQRRPATQPLTHDAGQTPAWEPKLH